MKLNILFTLFFCYSSIFCKAQQPIDVQQYRFQIAINDTNNSIQGIADLDVKFLQPVKQFSLDLTQVRPDKKGMVVAKVEGENVGTFQQQNDKVMVQLTTPADTTKISHFTITYSGIPADGLIISKNEYGDRTFFADNWPNRAHNWIPCNDVPGDKASVGFSVTAPAHYKIISNGILLSEKNMDGNRKVTSWQEDIALPTKVMVIGAADFAVARLDTNGTIPVTAWVYPQNKEPGFYDYGVAPRILKFLTGYIAPFPYKKLANVQSKTIFGGMENASCIFYSESSVTGHRKSEDLLAHEIAHQWFGDMATEKSFANLWLSEGFATYMTDMYLEHTYGLDSMNKRLQKERDKVIGFTHISNKPVVDSTSRLMDLLNANSYQKGAWILHMLRQNVGDTIFQKIVQTYYQQYKGSNANTRDFEAVAEKISGKDLKIFFDQWLFQPGIPKLDIGWERGNNQNLTFTITQADNGTFQFPLEIAVITEAGNVVIKKYTIKDPLTIIRLSLKSNPVKVEVDPHTHLLFEGKVTEIHP